MATAVPTHGLLAWRPDTELCKGPMAKLSPHSTQYFQTYLCGYIEEDIVLRYPGETPFLVCLINFVSRSFCTIFCCAQPSVPVCSAACKETPQVFQRLPRASEQIWTGSTSYREWIQRQGAPGSSGQAGGAQLASGPARPFRSCTREESTGLLCNKGVELLQVSQSGLLMTIYSPQGHETACAQQSTSPDHAHLHCVPCAFR